MKPLVLDSYAVICYLDKEPGAETVAGLFSQCVDRNRSALLSVVNWGEVIYHAQRVGGELMVQRLENAMRSLPIELVEITQELARAAALLKASHKLAYADCFAAALAKLTKGELATGDKEFKTVANEIRIIWI